MLSFGTYYSEENYNNIQSVKEDRTDWRNQYDNILIPAFYQFMLDMIKAGKVSVMETKGYELHFPRIWNHFVKTADINFLEDISYRMVMKFLFREDSYESFIGRVDNGESRFNDFDTCSKSGQRIHTDFFDWVPTLLAIITGEPVDDCPEIPAIYTVDINFPTGDLLISDWFRIDAFNNQTKPAEHYDINTDVGVIATTKWHAEQDFIHVLVSNTSPNIYQDSNTLVIGRDEDPDNEAKTSLEAKGRICTDLWWASIIDRNVLENMVGTEEVEKLMEDRYYEPHQIKVDPGTYVVEFSAHPDIFHEKYSGERYEGIESFFKITKK